MKQVVSIIALTILAWTTAPPAPETVVVYPFSNLSKDREIHWIGEGLSELMQERLEWRGLQAVPRDERVQAFQQLGIPYTPSLSKATYIKIAQQLGAHWVVLGKFDYRQNRLQVSAFVLDLDQITLSEPLQQEGDLDRIQDLSSRLGWQVMRAINSSFPLRQEDFLGRFPSIPNPALEHYVRGLIDSNEFRQVQYFRQADRMHRNYSAAIFQLGKIYHEQKDYPTSSLWFNKLFRVKKDFDEARFLLGLNHLYLKDYQKAVIVFRELSRRAPLKEVYGNLGVALGLQGLTAEATPWLEQAVEDDPKHPDFHFNLAYHLWKNGRFQSAIQHLARTLRLNPDDSEAHYLLHKCLSSLGRDAEAKASWKRAVRLRQKIEIWEMRKRTPNLYRFHVSFDRFAYRRVRKQQRRSALPETTPDSGDGPNADLLWQDPKDLQLGRLGHAEKRLSQMTRWAPGDAEARLLMPRLLRAKGKMKPAISESKAAVLFKDGVAARNRLSQRYLSIDQAEALLALQLDPKSSASQQLLAWLVVKQLP